MAESHLIGSSSVKRKKDICACRYYRKVCRLVSSRIVKNVYPCHVFWRFSKDSTLYLVVFCSAAVWGLDHSTAEWELLPSAAIKTVRWIECMMEGDVTRLAALARYSCQGYVRPACLSAGSRDTATDGDGLVTFLISTDFPVHQ
ncbi:hypothetical protein BJX61DRAFT_124479 [Aspergillus egyptiacus]|nr:hypothetical protein BJX61DRAFT_124479 [Aspergillus egyptiacus]